MSRSGGHRSKWHSIRLTQEVSAARRADRLLVAPTVGLSTAATAGRTATAVRANTFFGAP